VPTAAHDLCRRKQVRLRLRKNLVFVGPEDGGATVLKDPVSRRFFRLDARQRFAVSLMDGQHTLDEIRAAYEAAHRPDRLSGDEIESFAAQLLAEGLAEAETRLAGLAVFEQAEKHRRRALWSRMSQILWLRIPLCDPDRWLTRLLPYTRFVFTVPFALCGLACVLAALGLVATHWDEFLQKLPERQVLWQPRTLLYLWLALGLAKIAHEWGHGQSCKALGGEVHEAGVMLLLFFPALYCNTTDVWQLPRKRDRLAVSAAGIYVELLLAAAATFVWWLSAPASVVHHLSFGLMVACGVSAVVFNANPLIRSDGYYLLADLAEVPNLAEASAETAREAILRRLGVAVPVDGALTPRQHALAVIYAPAALAYRAVALGLTLYLLHQWLQPRKLASLGTAVAALAGLMLFAWPTRRWLQALHQQRSFRDMKPVRVAAALGVALAAVIAVALVPLPVYVEGLAVFQVEPGQAARVAVPDCGGTLAQLLVRDGQTVQEGQVIAVLTNDKQTIALRLNEADQALRLQQQQDLVSYLGESAAAERTSLADPRHLEFELQALQQQHAALTKQQHFLVVRAPRSGVVLGLCGPEDVGKWLTGGAELCRVGNPQALRAALLVTPGDRQLVEPGAAAHVRVHGGGSRSWAGTVALVAQVEAAEVPPQLASTAGGDVPMRNDKPAEPRFLVTVRFGGGEPVTHPGVVGRARIQVGSRTVWWRCRRWLADTFSWGL
jgi:putative peptide zinc metalloprotease protein